MKNNIIGISSDMKRDYIIAIDGPAASGKSTTAKELARLLQYTYIDTGAMYRAVALQIIRESLNWKDLVELERMLQNISIEFKRVNGEQRIFLNGEDVSARIREQDITRLSSEIAVIGPIRKRMVELQRTMGRDGGIVMDGRDIGTVVFPDADFKFFVIAATKTRALRRWKEMDRMKITIEEIEKELIWRDRNDSTRAIAPLRKAEDALEVDTTEMTIDEQVGYILRIIRERG
jgi:cytidylate kinase